MIKSIPADKLIPGDVLALPMDKTATIQSVKVGRTFITFKTEHGTSRVERYSDVLVEVQS